MRNTVLRECGLLMINYEFTLGVVSGICFSVLIYLTCNKDDKLKQTTWVYCPGCKIDLVSSPNRMVMDTDLVRYYCGHCYTVSEWYFDAPVPILTDAFYRDPNDWMKK